MSNYGIARKSLDSAGGAQLAGGQDFVFINGIPVVLLGDPVTPHGDGPHAGPVMVEASSFVFINGIPVCREGNAASCGHTTSGSDFVRVTG
jgi:uncharacterized Zn-binding protein involved in type VI secretion